MPSAPTDFTLTTTAGSPLVEAEWDHDGVDLDRFEILRRMADSSDPWERVILAPAGDFGAGPFSCTLVSTTATEFVVRALDADGVVST